jgi:hypothetical protein
MADKLTPTTLPEYLMWYEALQREIAWFLCQTMLARLQHGATRHEVLRWLLGRPFALTIPPLLPSGCGRIFRARMRRQHASARQAAGLRREPPSIVCSATLRKGTTKHRPEKCDKTAENTNGNMRNTQVLCRPPYRVHNRCVNSAVLHTPCA